MNKCTELDIKELLPDLLHGKLEAGARAQVEAHIASCEDCMEDLRVLRTVKSAAVFIPAIDVDRVVRQIPSYRAIVPAREVPARSRAVAWLVAASLVLVVAGGGSVLLQKRTERRLVIIDHHRSVPPAEQRKDSVGPVVVRGGVPLQARVNIEPPQAHALALATSVDALSDTGLRRLMNDMDTFDALPVTEPGPVISVDNGDSLDQGSR
jgi:hypothetical protein